MFDSGEQDVLKFFQKGLMRSTSIDREFFVKGVTIAGDGILRMNFFEEGDGIMFNDRKNFSVFVLNPIEGGAIIIAERNHNFKEFIFIEADFKIIVEHSFQEHVAADFFFDILNEEQDLVLKIFIACAQMVKIRKIKID